MANFKDHEKIAFKLIVGKRENAGNFPIRIFSLFKDHFDYLTLHQMTNF